MNKVNIFSKEEKFLLFEALKRLIIERKPIYEGYQKYFQKEICRKGEINKEDPKSKEGQ